LAVARPRGGAARELPRGGGTSSSPRTSEELLAPSLSPSVWPASAIPHDFAGREAITPALALLAGQLEPLAATFFTIDENGEVESAIAHGSHLPQAQLAQEVQSWEHRLRGVDPLAVAKLEQLPGRVATLRDVGGIQRAVLDRGWVRGTYEQIGAINDARLLIRDRDRLIAGVSLWRPLQRAPWSDAQLRLLAALQPLVELAYLSCVQTGSGVDGLPASLTPRQREVARLMARGATTPDIARALFISRETAKCHAQAVLTKLGVSSRRELVQRLREAAAVFGPGGGSPETLRPRQLLEPVLDWASLRLDARIGGCAFFSPRLEPIGEAWGGEGPDVEHVHREVLASASEIIRQLDADPGQAPVLQLGGAPAVPGLKVTPPLLAILRRQGHVAGLIWICRDAHARVDQRQSARELRELQPLLELPRVPDATNRNDRTPIVEELSERGLSEREVAVAQMALAGHSNAQIARRLDISESTVKKHMTRVLVGCGVRSRTQLIALLGE
jgi:DNA-binding NarL/FixJ family response regulator